MCVSCHRNGGVYVGSAPGNVPPVAAAFFFFLLAYILLLCSLVGLAVNGEGKAVIIAPKTSPICCLTDIKE